MASSNPAAQKIKPLLIALGVIGVIILIITQAPSVVRYLSA